MLRWILSIGLLFGALGCGGGLQDEQIKITPPSDPFAQAKATLQRYADGQPLSSEVTSFPFMVTEATKADAAKGELLKKGFEELQKLPPAEVPAKAKELLGQL